MEVMVYRRYVIKVLFIMTLIIGLMLLVI